MVDMDQSVLMHTRIAVILGFQIVGRCVVELADIVTILLTKRTIQRTYLQNLQAGF